MGARKENAGRDQLVLCCWSDQPRFADANLIVVLSTNCALVLGNVNRCAPIHPARRVVRQVQSVQANLQLAFDALPFAWCPRAIDGLRRQAVRHVAAVKRSSVSEHLEPQLRLRIGHGIITHANPPCQGLLAGRCSIIELAFCLEISSGKGAINHFAGLTARTLRRLGGFVVPPSFDARAFV
jgi:hypothetical protein